MSAAEGAAVVNFTNDRENITCIPDSEKVISEMRFSC
jgi:hypothetical protein